MRHFGARELGADAVEILSTREEIQLKSENRAFITDVNSAWAKQALLPDVPTNSRIRPRSIG